MKELSYEYFCDQCPRKAMTFKSDGSFSICSYHAWLTWKDKPMICLHPDRVTPEEGATCEKCIAYKNKMINIHESEKSID